MWPSGHQPERHEAWPQRRESSGRRALLPCWKTAVLADHGQGWPGACLDLFQAREVSDEQTCEALCLAEPRCPVWQFVNQTSPGQCWVGNGKSCAGRGGSLSTISVQGAQRIQHGDVRVLRNMSGWKVHGLLQLGDLSAHGGVSSVERCRRWCYSDIHCQYWQYGPGGCWVDSPLFSTQHGMRNDNVVQYPLTTDGGATNRGYEAEHMRWGEYIQHYCPPQPGGASVLADLARERPEMGAGTRRHAAGGSLAVQLLGGGWAWAPPALACLCLAGCACGLLWVAARAHHARADRLRAQQAPLPSMRELAPVPVPAGDEAWQERAWPPPRRALEALDGAGAAARAPDHGGRAPREGPATLPRQPRRGRRGACGAARRRRRRRGGAGQPLGVRAAPPCLAPPGRLRAAAGAGPRAAAGATAGPRGGAARAGPAGPGGAGAAAAGAAPGLAAADGPRGSRGRLIPAGRARGPCDRPWCARDVRLSALEAFAVVVVVVAVVVVVVVVVLLLLFLVFFYRGIAQVILAFTRLPGPPGWRKPPLLRARSVNSHTARDLMHA
ncbi:unnamed protein product [Prorocentrum cordatum]|uniref:Apple domain-containing protein n=1 Tax=Prorocentrum cordatum TaxID=2364126 RepID=A0ABN9PMI9_9DINO|nr:unnamed protein product [Polarella glacialis]